MAIDWVMVPIKGRKHWLWRAVDANGDVLDIQVTRPDDRVELIEPVGMA